MYVGFHLCIHNWCPQSGVNQQYTRCERASEDGRTCYNPSIKYGSTIGGYPVQSGADEHLVTWHEKTRKLVRPKDFKKSEKFNKCLPETVF